LKSLGKQSFQAYVSDLLNQGGGIESRIGSPEN
jgi:hypothetical protein